MGRKRAEAFEKRVLSSGVEIWIKTTDQVRLANDARAQQHHEYESAAETHVDARAQNGGGGVRVIKGGEPLGETAHARGDGGSGAQGGVDAQSRAVLVIAEEAISKLLALLDGDDSRLEDNGRWT